MTFQRRWLTANIPSISHTALWRHHPRDPARRRPLQKHDALLHFCRAAAAAIFITWPRRRWRHCITWLRWRHAGVADDLQAGTRLSRRLNSTVPRHARVSNSQPDEELLVTWSPKVLWGRRRGGRWLLVGCDDDDWTRWTGPHRGHSLSAVAIIIVVVVVLSPVQSRMSSRAVVLRR